MFYEDNPEILNKFLMYKLNNENLSSKTVQEYEYDLYNFLKAMKVIKKSYKELENLSKEDFDKILIKDLDSDFLNKISSLDIDYYISYLNINKKYKPHTRARTVASIKSFFKCLFLNLKEINNNPAETVKAPKLGSRIPKYLTLSEAQSLLNTVKNDNKSKFKERDYCIITLFLNCGMRLSELISIDITGIRDNDTINVLGKGNKERTVYLNNACKKALNDYIPTRNTLTNIKDKNALFLSERGTRLSRRTVEYIVEKYITMAGLDPNKFTPHKLRHTAATLMYGSGVDIRTLQEVLGHESIKTTEIYTHIDNGEIRKAVDVNPLNTEI
ncbi:MAG: tyrosine recombinase XerC [Clostridiales bacterium]|nr:tyrosine recombinase XerC [Clostridiales bacterium]